MPSDFDELQCDTLAGPLISSGECRVTVGVGFYTQKYILYVQQIAMNCRDQF